MGSSGSKEPQVDLDQYLQSQNHQQRMNQIYTNQQQLGVHENAYDDIYDIGQQQFAVRQINQNKPLAKMEHSSAVAIKNDMYINKTTFKMNQDPNYQNVYYLTFQYSTQTPAELSIYFLGKEDQQYINSTLPYNVRNTYMVQPIQNAEFKDNQIYLDIMKINQRDLSGYDSNNNRYPLIVKIAKLDGSQSFTYYCTLKYDYKSRIINVQGLKTKMTKDGQEFITSDVFGIHESVLGDKAEDQKDPCQVCLGNIINTMILPCKHTVLCQECCEQMRMRQQKCPICRSLIERYVLLQKVVDQSNQYNPTVTQSQQLPQQQQQQQPSNTNNYFKGQGVQIG